MTMAPSVSCPHCGATNPAGMQFCASCGKALPAPLPSGPRVVGSAEYAGTAAGQQLQLDQLHKQAKRASGALLVVAIITTVVAGIVFAVSQAGGGNPQMAQVINPGAAVIMLIVAAVFWGLYIWSRSQPLPAAIAGLVVYGTLVAVNVMTHLAAASEGGPVRGLGIGCLDVIIIIVLAQAISAGVKHRKMLREQAHGGMPA